MSYYINYDFSEKYEGEDYINLSKKLVVNDFDKLIQSEGYKSWYEENKDELSTYETYEIMESFQNSDSYFSYEESFTPMMNYIHILQTEPFEKQVELVETYVGNVAIIKIEELDTWALALLGGGMDLSDCLELTYYLTDGVSPIKANQIMSLSKEATELLEFCRKQGTVCLYDIEKYLKEKK